ncbi:hypothetical protein CUR178_04560 [Leishmania enriettii]|uniref:Uncharacterized protein n=1 Tax=Leishmania enriettii TaxID=5663 RepID=A0A836GJX7_LEIEN|nr:hypothetical protein CUR178_04560 [Leishmania enriettii]
MPKRHRQPEPIDIKSTARRHGSQVPYSSELCSSDRNLENSTTLRASSTAAASDTAAAAAQCAKPISSPGEIKLANEIRKRAKDFPATPESLVRRRRQLEASAKRRRISFDKDGQPVNCDDGPGEATPSTRQRRPVPVPGTVSFPSLPGRPYSPASDGFGSASYDDGDNADADIDFSSNDYVGDDGNQPSSDDSALGGGSEGDSAAEEEEVQLRQLRKAVAAADAQRRQRIGDADEGSSDEGDGGDDSDEGDESTKESSATSSSNDGPGDSSSIDEGDESESDVSDLGGESDSHEQSGEEEEENGDGDARGTRRRGGTTRRGSEEYDDDDDDDGSDGLVTVDFGVFDMEKSNIHGVLHLMDQLCPDKMNEVDRDELGLALHESPFTSVVRLQNNGEGDASGEEEQEFYGLSSVLDIAHGQTLYPSSLRPLCEILRRCVWRQAASGIPPTDILTSVVDGGRVASSRAKCLLLISEYIRNIPLELTVQILEDLLDRLDAAGQQEKSTAEMAEEAKATRKRPIFATHPSMLAVLAKVQRATDAPVTLPKRAAPPSSGGGVEGTGGGRDAAAAAHRKHHNGGSDRAKKRSDSAGGSGSSVAMSASEPRLDLAHYIFWREEDSILYEFRDKRVATLAYRCRPQYDGQPEHEIPLSILFVLQYGAARQAVGEMRRRQTVSAAVERY